ncbi:Oidioi.mRNA.OKI2018_I69.chr1.g912.t1.cds [Oikopleura dioica]|uniref:Oidioi.mRNA.OKI2018_I69.chr1.g912.t1.cds n=1 Tax=Oikopleura dioica TaxID=34765 RepID=A0ABN7SLD7_OIKDI|nr:Oidioi.mRNA.OKI2018_I69.chr1.g912.t1.cds [Oikopleura dioica]
MAETLTRNESDLTDPDPDDIFSSAVLAANYSDDDESTERIEEEENDQDDEDDFGGLLDRSFVESGNDALS